MRAAAKSGVPEKGGRAGDLDALLRDCVECGLCLPHCATWVATGNEVMSPRGRLLLLADLIRSDSAAIPATADVLRAFDACIGCRACESVCPSGVPFSLLEHGQRLATADPSIAPESCLPRPLRDRLDSPGPLRRVSRVAEVVRRGLRVILGDQWRRRLAARPLTARWARLLGSLPQGPGDDADLLRLIDRLCGGQTRPDGARSGDGFRIPACEPQPSASVVGTVAFFAGCANAGLLPQTSRRVRHLIRAAGWRVTTPPGQQCCGALADHSGRPGRAARLQAANARAFGTDTLQGAVLVAEAAGCGLALRDSGGALTLPVQDAVAFLADQTLPRLRPLPLRVAVHDPCHARHGQGIVEQPRRLLRAIPGLDVVEPAEPEVCCGSGGTWGLRYPDLSAELGRRKAGHLLATGADLIVTSNPGCLGQIADALALCAEPGFDPPPIIPLTDLLWCAAVGPPDC